MRPIQEVARDLDLAAEDLSLFGDQMAKLRHGTLQRLLEAPPRAKLILVSAMTPTKSGEGKTTTSVGLAQGLARRGKRAMLALRQPSLGPVFGAKGGGTGGGRAQLVPSERINLHFTGDLHAIGAANNLLAALVDNALHFRAALGLDPRRVLWRRALDMNDRSLRRMVIGLGGTSEGVPRETGFDITAASEVMATLCLASGLKDLKARLARIIVGLTPEGRAVTAGELGAEKPMSALLADAILPNLAQSHEGTPAFVHGGPFANIAHGCSSVVATRAASALADYVVTEAGFGFDLGGEKFFDLKCRSANLWPHAVVLVVTARALLGHGSGAGETNEPVGKTIERGMANVDRHIASCRHFGFQPVIAINVFSHDSEEDLLAVEAACRHRELTYARCDGYRLGGAGAEALADRVVEAANRPQPAPTFLYPLESTAAEKLRSLAKVMYGATDVSFSPEATAGLKLAQENGHGQLPVCVAKTHMSFSDEAAAGGNPAPFTLKVRDLRVRAGAGFLLALAGDISTMPGLPRVPASNRIDVTDDGDVVGIE